jgi:hypothetical protein
MSEICSVTPSIVCPGAMTGIGSIAAGFAVGCAALTSVVIVASSSLEWDADDADGMD